MRCFYKGNLCTRSYSEICPFINVTGIFFMLELKSIPQTHEPSSDS